MEDATGKVINIKELEASINRCRAVQPAQDGVLSQPVRSLATVYGLMIWHRVQDIDTDALPGTVRDEYVRFYGNSGDDGAAQGAGTSGDAFVPLVVADVPLPSPCTGGGGHDSVKSAPGVCRVLLSGAGCGSTWLYR